MLSLDALDAHPWQSLWYLHTQPPLYNGLGAVLVQLPFAVADSLTVVFGIAFVGVALGCFAILRRLGTGPGTAGAVVAVAIANPNLLSTAYLLVIGRGILAAIRTIRSGLLHPQRWGAAELMWIVVGLTVGLTIVGGAAIEFGENGRFRAGLDPMVLSLALAIGVTIGRRGWARLRSAAPVIAVAQEADRATTDGASSGL